VTGPDSPPASRPADSRWRPSPGAQGLLVFLLTLAAALLLLALRTPLLHVGGLTDEWFALACNLSQFGTLGLGDEPFLLRAPGYPFFAALILRLLAPVPPAPTAVYLWSAARLVCCVQALLLALTALLLYRHLRRRVSDGVALAAALVFGLNPYSLLLAGMLRYDVLHLFTLVAGIVALDRAAARPGPWAMLGAGAVWGVATLVRPVTLLLPPFVLLGLGLRAGVRRALPATGLLVLGMAAAIGPWTARNLAVSGRPFMVNAQGWAALWASTAVPRDTDPNRYHWWPEIGPSHLMPIFRRVTGETTYSLPAYLRHNVALEDAFRAEALANLRRDPGLYAGNVVRAALTLWLRMNSSLIVAFQRAQTGEPLRAEWFFAGADAERRPTATSLGFEALAAVLTLLATAGASVAARRRDAYAAVPGAVGVCVGLAHALTYMDMLYYYVKLPFLAVFAALALEALPHRLRRGLCAALAAGAAALALALLLG
jgi:hypothetical protein